MLHAIGFSDAEMTQLLVHGWWNIAGAKMSKSEGNVVDPNALADKYGSDALRYYLIGEIVTGSDADFSENLLVERYNANLANKLGNFLNRELNMTQRYRDQRVRWTNRSWSRLKTTRRQVKELKRLFVKRASSP